MRAYASTRAVTLRKKIRKAHSKAGLAGTLYFIGVLLLAVLAFFPMLNIGGKKLWVLKFFTPILESLGGTLNWIGLISAVLYLWMLLVAVINFFRCFSKLGWLSRKSWKYVDGHNRNLEAMESLGKYFSGSFATIVSVSLLIWALQINASEVTPMGYAYVMFIVGLVVHFFAGLIQGKVSKFEVSESSGNLEEEPRECGIFVYFLRNVVQIAALVGILLIFLPKCSIGVLVDGLLTGANLFEGDLITTIVPVALQALIVICLFVLVKHATAPTEFNRLGMQGKGMKNYRVFSFFVFLLAVGAFAVEALFIKPDPLAYDFIYVALLAFIAFLVDCIFKTRVKEEDLNVGEENKNQALQPKPFCGPYMPDGQPMPLYPQPPMQQPMCQQRPACQQQQQPIYIPIYYPYPMQQPAPAPAAAPAPAPVRVNISPVFTSAPTVASAPARAPMARPVAMAAVAPAKGTEGIKTTPSPEKKEERETTDKKKEKPVEEQKSLDPVEVEKPLDPNKEWVVMCPRCGKKLTAREVSPYHRCPLCDKVFELRKFKAYVKKD